MKNVALITGALSAIGNDLVRIDAENGSDSVLVAGRLKKPQLKQIRKMQAVND